MFVLQENSKLPYSDGSSSNEETFFYSCIKKYLTDHREQLKNITLIDGTFDQRGGNQYKGSIKFVFTSKNNKNDGEYCFHLDFLL